MASPTNALIQRAACISKCIPQGMECPIMVSLVNQWKNKPSPSPPPDPNSGIQLVYHFDNDFDLSKQIYDVISNYPLRWSDFLAGGNVPTFPAGLINNCMAFDNSSGLGTDVVVEPYPIIGGHTPYFHLSGDRTFSIWANSLNWLDDLSGGHIMGVVVYGNQTQTEWLAAYDGTNRRLYVQFNYGAAQNVSAGYPVLDGDVFNHLLFTYTLATNTVAFYVNGVLVGTMVIPGPIQLMTETIPFSIGADQAGGFAASVKVDELNIWNRVLTQAEITMIYNGGAGLAYPFP